MSDAALALHEQFATPDQQRETASIGMWIFLMTEVMLFGGLFMAFSVYRTYYSQAFDAGAREMELTIGAVNTAVLICSSLTMALAVYSAAVGNQRQLGIFLVCTMAIGVVFLALKFTEYYLHYVAHKVPGFWFDSSDPNPAKVQLFFVFYFIMTALHATHMLIGEGILAVTLFRSWLGRFTPRYHTPVALAGLYWHFIDVVWVFLYAIFYVPGFHK